MVITALLIAAAAVSWYAHAELVNGSRFSNRAASALDNSDVRTVLADRMVGGLTRSTIPNALVVRPLLVPALATVADTSAFKRLFARAVRDRHRALINRETTFRFGLPVGEGVLFDSLRRVVPRVASLVPADLSVPVVRLDPHDSELAASGVLIDAAGWRWPLTLAALLAAAGAALLAGATARAGLPGSRRHGCGPDRGGRRGRARRVRGLACRALRRSRR